MAIPELSRRLFLRRSLQATAALAALPGLAPACAPGRGAPAPSDLRVLSPGEFALLDTVADALVPEGGAFETGARSVELARRIDAALAAEPSEVVTGLTSALWIVEYASGLLAGRPGRFSRKDLAGRSASLTALATSRLGLARGVFSGLKQLCVFQFYAADASWPPTGYDGPWVEHGRGPA